MNSERIFSRLNHLHTASLGVWLGSLVTVGGIAGVAFPTMKSLAPVLPGYRVPVEDHWSIAAGHVMNPAFFAVMIAGIGLGGVAVLAWKHMGTPRRLISLLALLLAIGTLAGLGMPMRADLREYWSAARAGEIEAAASAKSRFDALHPWSSRAMGTQAGVVALALAMAVASRRTTGTATP